MAVISQTHDPALSEAIAAALAQPEDEARWDRLEQLADELQRPDEVFGAYRAALETGLSKKGAPTVADRAVKFCQGWYIDTPSALPELLTLIVAKYPTLEWAFERLVVLLSSEAQWNELLTLYDRALGETRNEKQRRRLLNDAANLAKDFADQPDRAADYLQELLRLDPDNDKLVISLERLLERRERYDDLLTLWRDRIPKMATDEARAARARIAKISLDKLGAPDRAVAELRDLVEENPGHAEACQQLERILGLETAAVEARREALSLLRKTYEIVERPADVVRVLEAALAFARAEDAVMLRRELGNRLAILGRDSEAMAHFAALLREAPQDTDARKQLRQLAERSERRDVQADALLAAADASGDAAAQAPLWLEAANIRRALGDAEGAIALYRRVLESEGADDDQALGAAHQLDELLAQAGRDDERLGVLERLATLERAPSFRRQLLGEAARLAERLGDGERALACWRRVLEQDGADLEALGATIELCLAAQRWPDLIAALRQRALAAVSPEQRRADLVRVARIESVELGDPAAAIATWLDVKASHGEDAEVVGELDGLFTRTERFEELGQLLHGSVSRELADTAGRLVRLGDVQRERLAAAAEAARAYDRALILNPADPGARKGMHALLEGELALQASEALWRAYQTTGEWERLLELSDARSEAEPSPPRRAEILAETARLHETRAGDAAAAAKALARAVALAPHRLDLRGELVRVARASDNAALALEALGAAADAAADEPTAAAELRRLQARIAEEDLGDWAAALAAHQAASSLAPDDLRELGAVARTAARAGRWNDAGAAVVRHAREVGRVSPELLGRLEEAASASEAFGAAAGGLRAALDASAEELPPSVASALYGHVADWLRDRAGDAAAATSAAERAVALMPEHAPALKRLVDLQRASGGPELADTLMLIDRIGDERSLEALHDAAAVAGSDDARAVAALERLYKKASGLWLAGTPHTGALSPEEAATWALAELTERLVAKGERERAARLLLSGGELPLLPTERAAFNRRAASELVASNKSHAAIDAYRRALADQPDDIETITRLAELCERAEAKTGSVALRERELELTEEPERRLELRLKAAGRAAELEKKSGRVESLLANLAEDPGHPASMDALAALLDERGHYDRLADVFESQARVLGERGRAEPSAALWARAAEVAEKKLHDNERAVAAHKKVVELSAGARSLDALARLSVDKGEHAEAAKWLTRRLEGAAATERVAVLLKLARTQQQAGRESDAVATLRTAFGEAPQSAEVRKQLLPLLRQREDHKALAKVLAASVEHAGDEATVLAYAREAADLYFHRLDDAGGAVPVLRRAVQLAPDDRLLRRMLGDGLREAGELAEARELLTALVEAFGRRGSHERAEAHLSLARVLHALGERSAALEQLDIASKMDADNVAILRALAAQAREANELARAEAALRTLLLTARRLQGTGDGAIGTSEVLFELSSLARARGQTDQAEELAESAIESLADNDSRAPKLQEKLREAGEHELLLRLLEARLAYVQSPYRRGAILGEKASVLANLGKSAEALDARLRAIDEDPGSPLLHEGTRELAVAEGKLAAYVKHLDVVLDKSRRDTDAMIRCEVLLRLGEVAEKEEKDFEKASALYDQAESTGVRVVDVLRARARVAGARGDEDEHMRILGALANLGEDQAETRADALYRIAEVQLAAAETLEQGMETLRKALSDHPNPARGSTILRRASEQHPENEPLLDAYEQVARDTGDPGMLLHYLERRAYHSAATTEHAREAVQKAREIGVPERAERLMERAVDVAKQSGSDFHAVDWALLGLAERARERGDLDAAVRWLGQAADVAEQEPLFALCRQVAALAAREAGDAAAMAQLYEKLRQRDPAAKEAWQPLVDIYARLGDVDALERVVRETLDGLQEPADRNVLRLGLARALTAAAGRADDAITVLREALFDEPGHAEALGLLSESLERAGKVDELTDLLRDQLLGALDRKDKVLAKATALRLGPMLDRDAATAMYRDALFLGDDIELLHALRAALGDDHDPGERALLGERLLTLSDGEEAARLALELADTYQALDDSSGRLRALETGLERAPADETIRARLEQHYRDLGDAGGLARILEATAMGSSSPHKRLALLREAAAVYERELAEPARAVELLLEARSLDPDDVDLTVTLAQSMTHSGDSKRALALLGEALDAAQPAAQLPLLRARAAARRALEQDDGALDDLEAAYALAPAEVGRELLEALEDRRMRATMNDDVEGERRATMRSIEVLSETGESERAVTLLTEWTERAHDDIEALRRLRDLEATAGRYQELARTCARLVDVESGDEQVASAALLLEAFAQLGVPDHAREVLERVWAQQPRSARIRQEVRRLYELIGANQELAKLLVEEASTMEDNDEKIAYLRWAGEALLSVGDLPSAMPALAQVLALKPDDAQARCLLADAHVMLSQYGEAHALLDEAIAQSRRNAPDIYMFHHRKAYVFHAEGDHHGQLEALKKAHQHARKNGQVAAELAELAEALEQWDLAVATLRTITTLEGDCPISPALALVRQGRIALRLGDDKRARLCARRAAMTDPNAEGVQAFLAELGES